MCLYSTIQLMLLATHQLLSLSPLSSHALMVTVSGSQVEFTFTLVQHPMVIHLECWG